MLKKRIRKIKLQENIKFKVFAPKKALKEQKEIE
jgi:hypothetical protein